MKKIVCTCKHCGANANQLLENDASLKSVIDNWVVHQSSDQEIIHFRQLRELSENPPHSPVNDALQVMVVSLVVGFMLMALPNVLGILGELNPNQASAPNIEKMQKTMQSFLPYFCGIAAFFSLFRGLFGTYQNLKYEQEYQYIMARRELITQLKNKAKTLGACTYCKSIFSLKENSVDRVELTAVSLREAFNLENDGLLRT